MDEYISKHDVLVALMDNDLDHIQAPNGKEAVQIFSELPPAADVVPVVHSRWKYKCGEIRCPECGNRIHRIDLSGCLNFCPNCGTKMDAR